MQYIIVLFFIFVNAGMGSKHLVNAVGCPGHRNQIRIFIMCNAYFLLACTVLITQDERNGGVGNGGFGMANPNGEQEGGKGEMGIWARVGRWISVWRFWNRSGL